jgi:hypothetical protein
MPVTPAPRINTFEPVKLMAMSHLPYAVTHWA